MLVYEGKKVRASHGIGNVDNCMDEGECLTIDVVCKDAKLIAVILLVISSVFFSFSGATRISQVIRSFCTKKGRNRSKTTDQRKDVIYPLVSLHHPWQVFHSPGSPLIQKLYGSSSSQERSSIR